LSSQPFQIKSVPIHKLYYMVVTEDPLFTEHTVVTEKPVITGKYRLTGKPKKKPVRQRLGTKYR